MKTDDVQQSKDYARIEQAIRFLGENFKGRPSLRLAAENLHMSQYHFQRVFQRWAGLSPKKFLQYLTKEYAKGLLKTANVLDASFAAGLSGPGRLHDLFVSCEAMTPGEYKHMAKGLSILYGFHPTPFGECFIAVTQRGLCHLSFINTTRKEALENFRRSWKKASLSQDQEKTAGFVRRIFSSGAKKNKDPLKVICKGTNFQIKVWEALLKIPQGKVVTYGTIARMIGSPRAVRAVGNAVGRNSIAYLIPCHRVIREGGGLGGYRWGVERKKTLLAAEAAGEYGH